MINGNCPKIAIVVKRTMSFSAEPMESIVRNRGHNHHVDESEEIKRMTEIVEAAIEECRYQGNS